MNVSTIGQPRSGRKIFLTIGARYCVISPDCIHNVDNSQVPTAWSLHAPGSIESPASLRHRLSDGLRQPVGGLDHRRTEQAQRVIRIGVAVWRLGARPQRTVIRRTAAATSSSGSPTGQTEEAAARSGPSPSPRETSEDASPSRA